MSTGKIAKYSEEWYEMCSTIDSTAESLEDAKNSVISYENQIRDLKWEQFDLLEERIGRIAEESEWLIDMLSEAKTIEEETAKYTQEGTATFGLHAINYNTYLNQANRYAEELKNINKELANDPYNQTLLDRRQELLEAQRDAISNAKQERESIKSLVEEGIKAELDALQKLIDKYKDALQSQKDLYDYQNNVTDQANEISKLQKLISAYEGDTSEESRLRVQQYQQQLKEAQKTLYDTQYDRNISDTQEALDKLYEQYEETLNNRLNNVDKLVQDVIDGVNNNTISIVNAINEVADKYNYTLTDSMRTILSDVVKMVTADIDKTNDNSTTVGQAANNIQSSENAEVGNSYSRAINEVASPISTSMQIRKTGLSEDGKTYTFANGNTLSFSDDTKSGFKTGTDGKQYYVNSEGTLVGVGGGWQTINGLKFYSDANGALQTGWQEIDGKKYYFYKSTNTEKWGPSHLKGAIATGWQNLDNELYYFDSNGNMVTNTWKDVKVGSTYRRRFLKLNGKAFKNTSAKLGNKTYYFDKDGYLLTGKDGKIQTFATAQYKRGVFDIDENQMAWTQENGKAEAIIRPSDGAILTPLNSGDSVLNNKATRALFEFANNPADYFKKYTDGSNYSNMPTVNNTMNGNISVQFNINGANITDANSFMSELKNNPQFEKLIQSMTTDRLFGGSPLKKFKI